MSERRGRLRVAAPAHVPVPDALVETRLMTQVLVAELAPFGIASGGPKRHPGFPGYSGFETAGPVLQWRFGWTAPPVPLVVVSVGVSVKLPAAQPVTWV